MTPKRIGFIGFDGVVGIDLAGPVEAFDCAQIPGGQNGPRKCYEVVTIGLSTRPFVAESGLVFIPQKTFKNAPPLDTLVIPGGRGLRKPEIGKTVAAFVKARAAHTRRIVSICTGLYGLAQTGLLAGRKVTTHWHHAREFAHCFPELQIDDNAIFLKDGPFYTSAGATAGIDLSLSLIEEDYGAGGRNGGGARAGGVSQTLRRPGAILGALTLSNAIRIAFIGLGDMDRKPLE